MAEWVRVSKYAEAMQTEKGSYHVSAGRSLGQWRFLAWPPAPPRAPDRGYDWRDHTPTPIGCFDDAASAKRCCEDHARSP